MNQLSIATVATALVFLAQTLAVNEVSAAPPRNEMDCFFWSPGSSVDPAHPGLCVKVYFHATGTSTSSTDLYLMWNSEGVVPDDCLVIGSNYNGNDKLNLCGIWWSAGVILHGWEWSDSLNEPPLHNGEPLPWTGVYDSDLGYLYLQWYSIDDAEMAAATATGGLPD